MLSCIQYLPKILSFTIPLYQILQEIKYITLKYNLYLILHKIETYQDDVKDYEDLTFLERENCYYNIKAKDLIVANNEVNISFPFNLRLFYIEAADRSIISIPDKVYLQVSYVLAKKHLAKRL